MSVAVVTDSTAYLPDGLPERCSVRVVPLQVAAGGVSGLEGLEVLPDDVSRELAERRASVQTSMPTPAAFAEAYERAAAGGAEAVVSIHLSAELSGTCDLARRVAKDAPVPVHVVDSRSAAMGLGFPVLAAARLARKGGSAGEVTDAATEAVDRTRSYLYVDTLEHLRRGGRIGAARALLGTALAVKPILGIVDGRIAPLERARTASRALARLVEIVVAQAGDATVDLAVHHLGTPGRAAAFAERLVDSVPALRNLYLSEVGAVVGAHLGPGLLGVIVHRDS